MTNLRKQQEIWAREASTLLVKTGKKIRFNLVERANSPSNYSQNLNSGAPGYFSEWAEARCNMLYTLRNSSIAAKLEIGRGYYSKFGKLKRNAIPWTEEVCGGYGGAIRFKEVRGFLPLVTKAFNFQVDELVRYYPKLGLLPDFLVDGLKLEAGEEDFHPSISLTRKKEETRIDIDPGLDLCSLYDLYKRELEKKYKKVFKWDHGFSYLMRQ